MKGNAVITNPVTGAYSYSPYPDEFGADSFSFNVSDGLVESNIAIVSVNIELVNAAPITNDASINADANTVISGVLSAADVDGNALIYSIVSNGVQGVAVITNASTGDFSYVPNTDATGTDSFTFKVNDGTADSNTAMVSILLAENSAASNVTSGNDEAGASCISC